MSFPTEDKMPHQPAALMELIEAARVAGLSHRYINVLRHRLLDAIGLRAKERV